MDETERFQKQERKTEEQYAAIGRFAVKFEHLHHEMLSMVKAILGVNGLHGRFAEPLICDLAAEPLRKALLSLLIAHLESDEGEGATSRVVEETPRRVIESTFERIKDLIQERNDLIHRLWIVGWMNVEQTGFSESAGANFRNKEAGDVSRRRTLTRENMAMLPQEAEELTTILRRLFQWIFTSVLGGKGELEGFVFIDPEGKVRPQDLGKVAEAMTVDPGTLETRSAV